MTPTTVLTPTPFLTPTTFHTQRCTTDPNNMCCLFQRTWYRCISTPQDDTTHVHQLTAAPELAKKRNCCPFRNGCVFCRARGVPTSSAILQERHTHAPHPCPTQEC